MGWCFHTELLNYKNTCTDLLRVCQNPGLTLRGVGMARGSKFLIKPPWNCSIPTGLWAPFWETLMLRILRDKYVMLPQTQYLNSWSSEGSFILEDSGNFRMRYLAGGWRPLHTGSREYIDTRCFLSCSLSPRKCPETFCHDELRFLKMLPMTLSELRVFKFLVSYSRNQKSTQIKYKACMHTMQQEVLFKETVQDTQKNSSLLELECSRTFAIIWDFLPQS